MTDQDLVKGNSFLQAWLKAPIDSGYYMSSQRQLAAWLIEHAVEIIEVLREYHGDKKAETL